MTNETNPLLDSASYYGEEFEVMDLAHLVLARGKITRVRWIGGPYRWDLSYIHGVLPSGQMVTLCNLPAAFGVRSWERKGELIAWAREARVNAKYAGLLDTSIWSELC